MAKKKIGLALRGINLSNMTNNTETKNQIPLADRFSVLSAQIKKYWEGRLSAKDMGENVQHFLAVNSTQHNSHTKSQELLAAYGLMALIPEVFHGVDRSLLPPLSKIEKDRHVFLANAKIRAMKTEIRIFTLSGIYEFNYQILPTSGDPVERDVLELAVIKQANALKSDTEIHVETFKDPRNVNNPGIWFSKGEPYNPDKIDRW